MTRFDTSPRIGLGSSGLGLHGSREDGYRLLDAFVDLGGTLLDTAAIYSDWVPGEIRRSETIIGEWLKKSRNRNRLKIVTKGGHPPIGDASRDRLDAASLRYDVEESLRTLGVDRIDLYLLHRDDHRVSVAEILGTLGEFVQQGKLAALGVSNWDVSRIAQARMLASKPVANQPMGNILCLRSNPRADTTHRTLNAASFRQAESEDLTLMLYTAQCHGIFQPSKRGKPLPHDYDNAACRTAIGEIEAVADDIGADPGELVLAFLLHFSPRIVPLIGARNIDQLKQSMRALELRLEQPVVERLAQISGFSSF
ncbi:MAG: aldo/keto reductase [Devosia sp.]